LTAFAGYAELKNAEGVKLASFRELYGDYAEHIAFGSVTSLGLLFGMLVHHRAKFNIQELRILNGSLVLKNSRLFGKTSQEFKLKDCSLVESKGGFAVMNNNKKYFLDKRGAYLNLSLLKASFLKK
jgi:hypothetical protein